MTRRILALDIASETGWAFGEVGAIPRTGTDRLAPEGEPNQRYFGNAIKWLHRLLSVTNPDVLAIEAAIDTSSMSGQRKTSPETHARALGLQAVMQGVWDARGKGDRIVRLVNVKTARVTFLGKGAGNLTGKEAKPRVRARCIELGWLTRETATFDKADACAVWAHVCCQIDKDFAANFTPLGTSPANIYRLKPEYEIEF